MATTRRSKPYCYVTWLTKHLAGEDQCLFKLWFRTHFKFDSVAGGVNAEWVAQHNDMLQARAAALRRDGWTVTVEDQNKFTVEGHRADLGGKADILAVRDADARVVDCKTGKRRASDVQQLFIYIQRLPTAKKALLDGKRLVGEVQYRDGSVDVMPEELTPEVRQRINDLIVQAAADSPPAKVPSFGECQFCPIGSADCPERVVQDSAAVATADF